MFQVLKFYDNSNFVLFSISAKRKLDFINFRFGFFYFNSIPCIPTPIPLIPTEIPHISTTIPRIPTLIPRIPTLIPRILTPISRIPTPIPAFLSFRSPISHSGFYR